ncbi:hypothetical protein CC80DRAFT_13532 [Byssothecium circinans]|uniref:Uncharacterized protein n=1 Tax=Byssothecium circinans TaxID=147558 RepID=A0A6A5UHJ9_9PLEO|nr:hypothetical protein CC80DRAFT_13532 [Byssothecium circinans]
MRLHVTEARSTPDAIDHSIMTKRERTALRPEDKMDAAPSPPLGRPNRQDPTPVNPTPPLVENTLDASIASPRLSPGYKPHGHRQFQVLQYSNPYPPSPRTPSNYGSEKSPRRGLPFGIAHLDTLLPPG